MNILDCRSVYRLDDAVQDDEEVVLLAKTTDQRYSELRERVVELHPYDVPCIERFEESDTLDAFAQWRADAI